MSETKKPTHEQLIEEDGCESVFRETDDSWRHGVRVTEVFHRAEDDTYWMAKYRLSTCGETHELRDGECRIGQVQAVETLTTKYEPLP
jgi:hypothetical protein